MKKVILFFLFVLNFIFLSSCLTYHRIEYDRSLLNMKQLELRDSLALVTTINQWEKARYDVFNETQEDRDSYTKPLSAIIMAGFYSPNKLKSLFWIVRMLPIIKSEDNKIDYLYFSLGVVGIRDDTNCVFRFFPYHYKMCEALDLDFIDRCMGEYYTKILKYETFSVEKKKYNRNIGGKVITIRSKSIEQLNGYNLQDSLFWEKSLLFYKGSFIKGCYRFEVDDYYLSHVYKNMVNSDLSIYLEKTPEVNYPDSILKLYPKSYQEKLEKDKK